MIRNLIFLTLMFAFFLKGFAQQDGQHVFKQVENTFEQTRWAETLEDITELPVGIRETKDGMEYAIIITQATFLPEQTLVNAYARLTVPDSESSTGKKQLFFGATGLSFSYEGQIVGDMRLSLLGDFTVSSNKNWEFLLRGGSIDTRTGGTVGDLTYITFDCDGLREIALNGVIRVSPQLIVPVDERTYTPIPNGRVETSVVLKAESWNNLLLRVSLPAFAITKQVQSSDRGAFVFESEDIILDMSDTHNAEGMFLPQGYEEYLVAEAESWRGFYMGKLKITLPEEFKKSESRVSFSAERFILDSYGVSGSFSAENLISLNEGTTSGGENAWRYSLDFIKADFMASKIKGGALSGRMLLPIESADDSEDTADIAANDKAKKSSEKGILFTGTFTDDDYMLRASSLEKLNFDLWRAQATIEPSSYLELRVKNKKFIPKAVLNGQMSLRENSTDKNSYEFNGITFRKFTLQTEEPYISAEHFGVTGEQRLANFPVSVKDVNVNFKGNRAMLNFGIRVGLQKDKFSAEGGFSIYAKREKASWRYDTFDVSELALNNVDVVVATVSGRLKLMKDDPLYGNGFRAMLAVEIENPAIKVDANAVFGNKDFRYWGFDAAVDGLNIPASFVNITGFVGGAYYRMRPEDGTMANKDKEGNISGIKRAFELIPDASVELELKAGVLGAFQSKNVASFMAILSLQTNKKGGLARVGIDGEATIMYALQDKLDNPFESLQEGFTSQVNNLISMEKLKKNDLDKVLVLDNNNTPSQVDVSLDKNGKVKQAPIYATMAMNYDFSQKAFHANMEAYVNVAGGIIKGRGNNGLAGRAVIHIDPKDWYIHIGTSREMIGLQVGFGNLSVKAQSYFMIGTKIYETPEPPAKVAEILGMKASNLGYMQSLNQVREGKGFAFGSHLNFDTGDINAGFIYARFAAGLGSDIMLKNYGNTHCKNRSGELGINGWYASGQTYVYLQGELGIRVRLFFVRKNIPILKAGVAAILQGSGPNPFWARGYLGGYYNVLGGLVKGRFRLKMEFGEQCELAQQEVLGGMKIISEVSPSDKSTNVDVFIAPQVSFNLEVEKPIVIPEDDGDHTYVVKLEKLEMTDEKGGTIKGKLEFGKSSDVVNFIPTETLSSNTKYKITAQVSFQELKGNSYQTVMVDGKKALEVEERTFVTGVAPEYIPNKNIQYAYPVLDQKNYFVDETKNAFIQLKQGQAYLFESDNWETQLHLTSENGNKLTAHPSYNAAKNAITYTMPKLDTGAKYTLSIVSYSRNITKKGKIATSEKETKRVEGGYDTIERETSAAFKSNKAQASVKEGSFERLTYSFKASKYKSLQQKMNAFKTERKLWDKISSDVVTLFNNMNTDESFEVTELLGTAYTDGKPLFYTEAVLDDTYDAVFKKYLYTNPQVISVLKRGSSNGKIGFPPKEAISVVSSYAENLQNNSQGSVLKRLFPYRYDVLVYYRNDWTELGRRISDNLTRGILNPTWEAEFMERNFPAIPEKKYKAILKYRLPNGEVTSEVPYYYQF
ncbi:Ig-like domain-containing protein [Capnocytophaga canimorsus]|uniref:Ig-like domain-containing protein n=1 Tax=Capnocytophaga canimorsus TaxID=28188 RepID=UPI0037CE40BE